VTHIILSLLLGVLLLGLSLYWLLRSELAAKDVPTAQSTLENLRATSFRADLIHRALDDGDFLFVYAQKNRQIVDLLEAERKAIAMCWLQKTRRQVKVVMAFHVKSARHNAGLVPMREIKLAFEYLNFLLVCDALRMFVWMCGPFRARKVARRTVAAKARLYAASERILMITTERYGNAQEAPRSASAPN
jgi:hypothetical protein